MVPMQKPAVLFSYQMGVKLIHYLTALFSVDPAKGDDAHAIAGSIPEWRFDMSSFRHRQILIFTMCLIFSFLGEPVVLRDHPIRRLVSWVGSVLLCRVGPCHAFFYVSLPHVQHRKSKPTPKKYFDMREFGPSTPPEVVS